MLYLFLGIIILAYLLYLYNNSTSYLTGSQIGSGKLFDPNGNFGNFLAGSDKNTIDNLENIDNELCQRPTANLIPKNPCKMSSGMNILTYLGLGPADQDQLNIINHKDHNNLAWILRRPLHPPRKLINNLQESNTGPTTGPYAAENLGKVDFKTWNPCKCDVGIVNLDRPPTELEGVTDAVAERLVNGETHNILYNLSPEFMRTGVKQYYGGLYYNDVRYPERPISVEFATDPAGYCMRRPQEYPCPLIASRKDIR